MYAVIGAGPMGLATARNLSKYDIPFIGFDLNSDVGGLWDIDNPHSTMYQSAHLISSKGMTEFSEFPMPDEVATYPHHSEMKRYFQAYARHFDLYRHYEFSTRVVRVERRVLFGVATIPRFSWALASRSTSTERSLPRICWKLWAELRVMMMTI